MNDAVMERLPAGADRLAYARRDGEPDVALLQNEYDYAWSQGQDTRSSTWSLVNAEDVRFNRWQGRSWDGLKWEQNMPAGKECRPYNGAPDCRIPLADETIDSVVDILFASFFAARVNPRPVHASRMTAQEAGEWKSIVNWMMHGPLAEELINNVEFLAQCGNTFGWCVVHPTWQRRNAWQTHELTMEQIQEFAAQAPEGSVMREVPGMIMASGGLNAKAQRRKGGEMDGTEEEPEDGAHGVTRPTGDERGAAAGTAALRKDAEGAMVEIFTGLFEGMSKAEAKKCLKDLREKGSCEFQVPVLVESVPSVEVLVPGLDYIPPPEMTDPQRARIQFRRKLYSTAEVEAMAERDEDDPACYSSNPEEGWSQSFCAEVLKTAGQGSSWTGSTEQQFDENARLIEIIFAYAFQVKDGVPGIWVTVFSPNLRNGGVTTEAQRHGEKERNVVETSGAVYGKHYLLDMAHLKVPFLVYQTEVTGKRPDDARGIPERLVTQQLEMKRQRDALFIRAELETTPPLTKVGARASKLPPEFGPLAVFNMTRQGEWEWFAPPSGNPTLAFQLFETIKQERDEQHGLPNAKVHPGRWQARQRRQVMRWLLVWGQALWQLSVLAYQNLSQDELTEVLGHPPMLSAEKLLKHRLGMDFDVRTLDPDWVQEILGELKEIIMLDTGGTVDRSKLVALLLSYLDSTLADEVTTDQKGAAKKVFEDVRNEVAQIMLGNEAQYVENDPTAKMKLQFLQQILMSNPDYIMQVHPQSKAFNPRKAELLQKYSASLQQSAVQSDNKLVGRIGVKPVAMDQPKTGRNGG